MRVILGIGNPGNKYKNNRHNAGFKLLDYFALKSSLSFVPSKGSYYYCSGKTADSEYCLVKPTTYVNNSGVAAAELAETLNLSPQDFLIVHDDINLELGKLKVKISGGDGGHNGISSIIYHLYSNEFARLRIGVGSSFNKGEMADYVLSDFSGQEEEILSGVLLSGFSLIDEFIIGGVKRILDANSLASGKNKNAES